MHGRSRRKPRGERAFDIFSRLLQERIVCLNGMVHDDVSAVVVAQLLYLNYENPSKEVFMYVNSVGTGGCAFETEAFALVDTMNYVAPPIETICLGTAFGTAAMLLASGEKGKG